MKKIFWMSLVILLIAVNCSSLNHGVYYNSQNYYPVDDSSYVYNYLSPYGNWIEMSPYGYVWIPRHMGYRWRPYTEGQWAWSDYGWTWVSDYPWGDIPFHYGRWGWDDDLGWYWVPGDVWGPAWVSWRYSDNYLGWAPLPPGISFSFGMDFDSLYYNIPSNYWIFVESPNFYHHRLGRYVLPYERNRTIINYTRLRNNIRLRDNRPINEGIDVDEVRRITGRSKIDKFNIREIQKPGHTRIKGQEIQIFRPEIKRFEAGRPKEYLQRDEAKQKLAPVKIWEPRVQHSIKKEESAAQRRQDEERKILNKSQAQEIKDMNRRRAAEEQKIRDNAEREKIRKEYENRVSELKKQHEAEKKDIQVRHSDDSNQIKKQNTSKKYKKKD
ncbi:MAG TPA: DUF6600 domain-containing protein [Candidatus Kapabacteria bacterium]|nr:DUF6600 domain-containing protein [Candidatus Kapabacteria bacterium]